MTEKQALLIAYNILNDELDRCEEDWQYTDSDYITEIKGAVAKINEMYKAR